MYFNELANTSRRYFIGYVEKTIELTPQTKVLEIGCGEGGNLVPFSEIGCDVTGIDLSEEKINNANIFFSENKLRGKFLSSNFFSVQPPTNEEEKYDLLIANDMFEHIEQPDKIPFLRHLKLFMRTNAIIFIGFPGWQMPYGGHQQICTNRRAQMPFIHLLPEKRYIKLLHKAGEQENTINELLSIRRSKLTIESFEKIVAEVGLHVKDRTMWVINPHYKQKFHLLPLREIWPFTVIPYLRNYYTTAAWYKLELPKQNNEL